MESHVALPEERELSQKTQELHRLETELAERELTLATLQAQVRDFEQDYLRRVGRLYAALDEVTAELAALELREHPGSAEFERAAHETRARAERSAQEAGAAPGEREKPPFKASPELSKLYRMLAKLVHPDLCTAEPLGDREDRELKANRAVAESCLLDRELKHPTSRDLQVISGLFRSQ